MIKIMIMIMMTRWSLHRGGGQGLGKCRRQGQFNEEEERDDQRWVTRKMTGRMRGQSE